MVMKVYHGSYKEIDKIDLSQCRSHTDFGKGFYVTKFRRHAENWAERISKYHHSEGYVTKFDFIDSDFTTSICKIKRFTDYNEEWLDFVVVNRDIKTSEPAHDYDIVEGPVADDKIQNEIDNYLQGKISKIDFLKKLKYHEETHQICFCTLVSLQVLERTDNAPVRSIENIGEQLLEALMLERNIDEILAGDLFYTSDTFSQLADTTTQLYEKPWTEIYEVLKKELNT
jgi:hypothetical protein